jgi:tRNA-Thr(GGU) m(6)t(6)A37 methyltransferase TsaA
MDTKIILRPIAVVRTSRTELRDDNWGNLISTIELDSEQFTSSALLGIEEFSHIEVIFFLNRVLPETIITGARHPRDRTELPQVGIFAQRSKNRPNCLGLSRCKVLKVQGLELTVQGLDALDGTPVLDIKPYISEFAPRGEVYQPAWSREVMAEYYATE